MLLLKKFGGLDLYKKVEEALDAIHPDPGSGNKPPLIHFRSITINGTSWIKPPSGNDYEACWRRSWDARNKDFSWDAWKWVRNCHDPKCDAAFWIEWAETWQMAYTEAAAAAFDSAIRTKDGEKKEVRRAGNDQILHAVPRAKPALALI